MGRVQLYRVRLIGRERLLPLVGGLIVRSLEPRQVLLRYCWCDTQEQPFNQQVTDHSARPVSTTGQVDASGMGLLHDL